MTLPVKFSPLPDVESQIGLGTPSASNALVTFRSVGICCCIVGGNAGLRKVISQKKFHPNSAVV